MKKQIFFLLLLILNSINASAWEWPFSKKENASDKAVSIAAPPSPTKEMYEQIFSSVDQSLQEIDNLIKQQEYGKALSAAKDKLDDVRLKTGIDPRAKIFEKIEINGVIVNGDLGKPFDKLTNAQRDAIAISVSKHKGGRYLDLLNLTKRVTRFYLIAKYLDLKSKGTLYQHDENEILQSLVSLVTIPIYLQDKQANDFYMVFDEDVAQTEQIEFFNHEVEDFFVQDLKRTPSDFDIAVQNDRVNKLKNHWNSIAYFGTGSFDVCIKNLSNFQSKYCNPRYRVYDNDCEGGKGGIWYRNLWTYLYRIDKPSAVRICKKGTDYANCVTSKAFETKFNYSELSYTLSEAESMCLAPNQQNN